MVINQDCCRSCRSIIPEGVLFGIQKISVSLFVCFTCKFAEVTIIAKTGDGRSKSFLAGIQPQTTQGKNENHEMDEHQTLSTMLKHTRKH